MYKEGDKLVLHSVNGETYDIEIISINEFRPPEEKYGVDMYCKGEYYGDVYFCGEAFLDKCEVVGRAI